MPERRIASQPNTAPSPAPVNPPSRMESSADNPQFFATQAAT